MARWQRQPLLHQQCRKAGCKACRRCCQMSGAAWVRGQMLWAVHASGPCRRAMHPNQPQTHAPNLQLRPMPPTCEMLNPRKGRNITNI